MIFKKKKLQIFYNNNKLKLKIKKFLNYIINE